MLFKTKKRGGAVHAGVRLKYFLYSNYWWLLIVGVGIAIAIVAHKNVIDPAVGAYVGSIFSLAYFLQKQKIEEMRLFREIFKECNGRYDQMNEKLASIVGKPGNDITPDDESLIVDYLNLCAEEYLYYRRGYIEPSVWQAWQNGMKSLLASPNISSVWKKEKASDSHYGLPL